MEEDIPSRLKLAILQKDEITNNPNPLYNKKLVSNILDYTIENAKEINEWEVIRDKIIEAYKKGNLELTNLKTTIASSIINYLPSKWKPKALHNYSNLITILKKYILSKLSDKEKSVYFEKLNQFQDMDIMSTYLSTKLKDNKLDTIINATKTFLSNL